MSQEKIIFDKPLSWWLKNYELPVHIYSAPEIRRNLKAFKEVFSQYYPKSKVCFAAKACTHKEILKIVKEENCGADVASFNEARCALEAGIAPNMLDLNGNCKEDASIVDAIKRGMNVIADSFEEFENVAGLAAKIGKKPKILLRVSGYQLDDVTDDSVFTAGVWCKFGADLDGVPEFLKTLDKYPSIQLVGFHTHIGSQVSKVEPYLSVMGRLIELGHLLQDTGRNCEVINIGGGFPVQYVDKKYWDKVTERIKEGYLASTKGDNSKIFVWRDGLAGFSADGDPKIHLDRWTGERFYTNLPKEKMLEALLTGKVCVNGKTLSTVDALNALGEPTLTIEPGRSIAEDAGVTLAKVGIIKKTAKFHNLTNIEMGITSHGESLIEKPVKKWELVNDPENFDKEPFETFIGGNLCFSGDMISKYKVFLQRKPKRGDIIMIHNTGAYTSSLFSANSNSFPRPARVLVDEKGRAKVFKKRDRYQDIFS